MGLVDGYYNAWFEPQARRIDMEFSDRLTAYMDS